MSGFTTGTGGGGLPPITPIEEEEDELEQSFDDIVAQAVTDIGFTEELGAPPVGPTHEPAPPPVAPMPPVELQTVQPLPPPPPAPPPGLPGLTAAGPGETLTPEPNTLLEELIALQTDNQMPGPLSETIYTAFLDREFGTDLVANIEDETRSLTNTETALAPALPPEMRGSILPRDLSLYYQNTGITPSGPLAGLNSEFARKNAELVDLDREATRLADELRAQDTESFTTQAQVDSYNATLAEYEEVAAKYDGVVNDLRGLDQEYVRQVDTLAGKHESSLATLFGGDGTPSAVAPLLGAGLTEAGPGERLPPPRPDGGLMGEWRQYTDLLSSVMQGGLAEDAGDRIKQLVRQGLFLPSSFTEGDAGPMVTLAESRTREAAREAERKERSRLIEQQSRALEQQQILELGFTTEQYQQMRQDPGFQEFIANLTSIETPGLDALGLSQIAARQSPYEGMGFDPIPEQAAFREMLAEDPGVSFDDLKRYGISTLSAVDSAIGGTPVLGDIWRAAQVPVGIATPQAYAAGRQLIDILVTGIGTHQYSDQFYQPPENTADTIERGREYSGPGYDELPWYVSLTGEILFDPLNFVAPVAAVKAFKAARLATQLDRTTTFPGVLDDAFKAGTAIDTAYVRSVQDLSNTSLSKVDTHKLSTSQIRFSKVAKDALGVRGAEADIFGTRITARLSTAQPSDLTDILNQEVGRMAERTGRTISDNAAAKLNNALADNSAFAKLNGSDFWNSLDGQFPRVMKDTPQWRQARNRELPDTDDVWSAPDLENIPLNRLVSVGYGPDTAMTNRWGGLIDFFGHSRTMGGSGQPSPILALPPPSGRPLTQRAPLDVPEGATGMGPPSEAMLDVLRRTARRNGMTLTENPQTLSEYWEAFYRVAKNKNLGTMPPGMTVDAVVNHPSYLALERGVQETIEAGTRVVPGDMPVSKHNLSVLVRQSMAHSELPGSAVTGGRNQLDRLAQMGLPGKPFSDTRAKYLINNSPALVSQRQILVKQAASKGKTVSNDTLDALTWRDAETQIKAGMGNPRSLGQIAQLYGQNAFDALIDYTPEQLARAEFKALGADLLTPAGEGRYVWTAGQRPPPGVTANGWLRMGPTEIVNLFRTAPARISSLPTFGPRVDEIGATAELAAKSPGAQGNSYVMVEARDAIDALVDEAFEVASLAENKYFLDWLKTAYNDSALARPGRPRTPRDLARSGAPDTVRLNQASSELAARLAERSAVWEQLRRLDAATTLAEYTKAGNLRRLDWQELAGMRPQDRSRAISEHFRNARRLTKTGFEEVLREARFMPVGQKVNLNQVVDNYQDLRNQLSRLDTEIAEMSDVADDLARQAGFDGLPDLSRFSNAPAIKQFADDFMAKFGSRMTPDPDFDPTEILANYKPENVRVHPRSDGARAMLRGDSTVEIAYAASVNGNRPAWHYTAPVIEAPLTDSTRVIASRSAWDLAPEVRDGIGRAFATHTNLPRNTKTADQIAASLTPANLTAADEASRALIIIGTPLKEAARMAGVSIEEMRRLRTSVIKEIEGPGISRQRIDRDAKKLMDAAGLASDVVAAETRRTGTTPGIGGRAPQAEIRGGRVRVPNSVGAYILKWLENQQKLGIVPQPGELTVRAAKWTNARLRAALDVIDLTLRSNSDEADRWARIEGIETSHWVRPGHQRPIVSTFDPFTRALVGVDWVTHGSAFDHTMRLLYNDDEVWGKMAKRLTASGQSELTKMSKSVKVGDIGTTISNRVWGQAFEDARMSGENLSQVYDNILDDMDEIVAGGPRARTLYGAMFDNSEEMQLWLDWARAKHPRGGTNWEQVKQDWGDLTPHMSLSRMPKATFDLIFNSNSFRRRKFGTRAPVANDMFLMDDFVKGKLDLSGLDDLERAEAELWRDLLLPKWDAEIQPKFYDATRQTWRRNVHLDDLDAILFPEEALDPFDAQKFSDNMGTKMTEIEMARLGYDPHNLPLMMRVTQFIKRTLGVFWLKASPRYMINNIFGNVMSLLIDQFRSGSVGGLRAPSRVIRGLENKSSVVNRQRMMRDALTGTEFTKKSLGAQFVPGERKGPSWLDRMGKTRGGKVATGYLDAMGKANDFFELHARTNVWSREFDGHYTNAWGAALEDIPTISPLLKDDLKGALELSDVSRITRDLTPRQRNAIFRAHHDAVTRADLHAYHRTREVMRDYLMRTRFDNALDQVFPYHFWSTKNLLFVTGTILDRPATVLHAGRVYDAWDEQWDGMPFSFKNKLHVFDVPEQVPVIGGSEIWLRPNNMTNPAIFFLASTGQEMKDAWDAYDDTTILERFQRSATAGLKNGFETVGYRPGPQFDAIATAGHRADKLLPEDARDEWRRFFESYAFPAIRPGGYRAEVIPLGGIEQAAPFLIAEGTFGEGDTVMAAQAYLNATVHGTPWTKGELNMMGIELTNMAIDGELGPVTVNENGTMNISREAKEAWQEVQKLVVTGDVGGLLDHPIGSQLLKRRGSDEAGRAGINYGTGLSITEYDEGWRRSFRAEEAYNALKLHDDQIPLVAGQASEISPFNKRIVDAAARREELVERGDFSPDAIAEASAYYDNALKEIYAEAKEAGVVVPQLKGMGPDAANQWAFGDWNPVTEEYEGAYAPWMPFFWAANDTPEEFEQYLADDADFQKRIAQSEAIGQAVTERNLRQGKRAPYFNDIDDISSDLEVRLARLNEKDYLSEAAKDRLADELIENARILTSGVYARAETDGVTLKGSGELPFNTGAWYDMLEPQDGPSNRLEQRAEEDGDTRAALAKFGLKTSRNLPVPVPLDQMMSLRQKEDAIQAHTNWVMGQVVEALDMHRFVPGTNEPNPKFLSDGFFDEELYQRELKKALPEAVATYNAMVADMRSGPPGQAAEVYARPITSDEFQTYVVGEVMPREGAWDLRVAAAKDEYYAADFEDRQAIEDKYDDVLGADWLGVPGKYKADHKEVATILSNFYNGLIGDERTVFEDAWGEFMVDAGEVKVFDPDKLDGQTASEIARKYDVEIPTDLEEYELSAGREAIADTFFQHFSKEQKDEFLETYGTDDYPGFVVERTGFNEETGESYTFTSIDVEQLEPEQVAEIRERFGIDLEPYPTPQRLPDEHETRIKPDNPKFVEVLEDAAFDNETQSWRDMVKSGEAFLDDPQDRANWQSFYNFIGQNGDLYDAAQAIKTAGELTWKELLEWLEPRSSEPGEERTIREFAEVYTELIEEYDMGRLWDARTEFFSSETGQSVFARDPEYFERYISEVGSSGGGGGGGDSDSGGGGGGSDWVDWGSGRGGSSSRYRSSYSGYGGGGSSRPRGPSLASYSGEVADILRLDTGMVQGTAPDAQARYDVATQVAELLQQRLEPLMAIPGGDAWVELIGRIWKLWVHQELGNEPSLALWERLLRLLQGEVGIPVSDALTEQPEMAPSEVPINGSIVEEASLGVPEEATEEVAI